MGYGYRENETFADAEEVEPLGSFQLSIYSTRDAILGVVMVAVPICSDICMCFKETKERKRYRAWRTRERENERKREHARSRILGDRRSRLPPWAEPLPVWDSKYEDQRHCRRASPTLKQWNCHSHPQRKTFRMSLKTGAHEGERDGEAHLQLLGSEIANDTYTS